MDDDVTAISRHVLGVQDLRGFAQLGDVHIGSRATNRIGHGAGARSSSQSVQNQLILATANRSADHLGELRALVKVDLCLREDVRIFGGVPVRQRAGHGREADVHRGDIGLRYAGSCHAATDFREFYLGAFDTTTLTHSAHQHCLALVSLFDFSIEQRHKGIAQRDSHVDLVRLSSQGFARR